MRDEHQKLGFITLDMKSGSHSVSILEIAHTRTQRWLAAKSASARARGGRNWLVNRLISWQIPGVGFY